MKINPSAAVDTAPFVTKRSRVFGLTPTTTTTTTTTTTRDGEENEENYVHLRSLRTTTACNLFGDEADDKAVDAGAGRKKDVLVCAIEKEARDQTSNLLRQLLNLLDGSSAVVEHDLASEVSLTSRLQQMEKETDELRRSTGLMKEKKIDLTSSLLSRVTEQRNNMMVAMRRIKLNQDIHDRDTAVAEWLQQSFATLESTLKLERLKAVNRVSLCAFCNSFFSTHTRSPTPLSSFLFLLPSLHFFFFSPRFHFLLTRCTTKGQSRRSCARDNSLT
jgi:hypothetical protein